MDIRWLMGFVVIELGCASVFRSGIGKSILQKRQRKVIRIPSLNLIIVIRLHLAAHWLWDHYVP